jgi:hypothetical protein
VFAAAVVMLAPTAAYAGPDEGATATEEGSTSTLVATGAPTQPYELRCYTRPSTTYVTSRSGAFT